MLQALLVVTHSTCSFFWDLLQKAQ